MSDPLVSFVIPCWGYARYLRQCLDSVLAQESDGAIEVIAINDASPDESLEILRSYSSDARVRIVDHEINRGHVYTVNEGLALARGKYVARIDSDDRLRPGFVARTVAVLERYPEVGLVYGDAALIDDEGRVTAERSDTVHGGRAFIGNEFVALLKSNFICAPTVLARREAWMQAWPVPDGLAFNDWYFNLMLSRRWQFCFLNELLADYRVHATNHHTRISRDGSEETSVFRILDAVFAQEEPDRSLEAEKRRAKADVYASHYLDLARKYFGHRMGRDARRCFIEVARRRPGMLMAPKDLRIALATLMPRSAYDRLKGVYKAI